MSSSSAQDTPDAIDPAIWRMAFTIIVGAMAVVFDTTIVSVALNDLTHELHASLSTVQWISAGYLLAMFVTIPVAGWAQTAIGGKRLWILALGIFLLGSVLCATAWDVTSLIVFRVVQGIGGGIMMPLMITLIMQAAGGRNLGRIMATVTLPATLGPILGPVIGGLILGVGSWRWLFLVNVPFCVAGAYLAHRNLPADPPTRRARLDVVGLVLVSPGVAAVVYGLSQVEGSGGFRSARVLVPVIAGLALVAAFVAWALPRSASALINLKLLRNRSLASASTLGFLAGVTLFGAMLLLPLYWQQARGEDALGAGLLLIPQGVGTLLSRTVVGRATDRFGPRVVALTGFTVVAVATVPFAFVTADTSKVLLLAALLVRGAGMAAATTPLNSAAYIGLAREEIPHASIISRVTMLLGGSVGTAVLAVVLQHFVADAHTPTATADAFGNAFWWSVGFTVAAIPLGLLLPGRPQPLPEPERTEVEAEAEVESAGLA